MSKLTKDARDEADFLRAAARECNPQNGTLKIDRRRVRQIADLIDALLYEINDLGHQLQDANDKGD